jgi:hypothetical protein
MKAIIILTLLCCPLFADGLTPLLDAIRQVESGGNDNAIGDGGQARGPYQIHRAYWQDACEYGGVTWSYDEYVTNRAKCEQVIRWYWLRYAPKNANFETLARIHNGGMNGHLKSSTRKYWRKVQKHLKKGK